MYILYTFYFAMQLYIVSFVKKRLKNVIKNSKENLNSGKMGYTLGFMILGFSLFLLVPLSAAIIVNTSYICVPS